MSGSTRDVKGRARNARCPCGSGRKRKACCRTVDVEDPGVGPFTGEAPEWEVVDLTQERAEELLALLTGASADHAECPGECPLCALVERWADEDRGEDPRARGPLPPGHSVIVLGTGACG